MTALKAERIETQRAALSLLRGGPDAETVLFLHGGIPGVTPYCSGAHIWAPALPLFARLRHVVAPDLPGFGDTPAPAGQPHRIDDAGRHALALIGALGRGPCHVVGHAEGALVALWMALENPAALRSVTVAASPAAAPIGDNPENLALAHPPTPRFSRASQAWALERLSWSHHHIDAALLDRCVAAAASQGGPRAEAGAPQAAFGASVVAAKSRFYAHCRTAAFPVPVQIVWGRSDPLTTLEHGMVLFKTIAARQAATHYHVLNRSGHFPFREEPQGFEAVVSAFHDGLAARG
ncbi:MAG: alpha/beta hydrolase [Alphaproteobacteria bacterium]